jgi:hypothetical protein
VIKTNNNRIVDTETKYNHNKGQAGENFHSEEYNNDTESPPLSNLVPENKTETSLAKRLVIPLKERRLVKRFLAALSNTHHPSAKRTSTHTKKITNKKTLTAQVKHSQHHFPPSASTASIPSLMLFLHRLHFGNRSLT